MERGRCKRRLRLAKVVAVAAATATATLTTLVTASDPRVAPADGSMEAHDVGENPSGTHHVHSEKRGIPISESKLRELRQVSTQLQTIHEHNLWSADSLDIIHSLENSERRRLTDVEGEAPRKSNLRRRGLAPKTMSEERKLGRGVGMRRSDRPTWQRGGKSNKSAKKASDDRSKHYVVVDRLPPLPAPPAPPALDDDDDGDEVHMIEYKEHENEYVGGWVDEVYEDEEECYDVDELGHIVWVSSGSGDGLLVPDDDEEEEEEEEERDGDEGSGSIVVGRNTGGRWGGNSGRKPSERNEEEADEDVEKDSSRGDGETDRWDGNTNRGPDSRKLGGYYYVTYDDRYDAKSRKKDSKSGKKDSKSAKMWSSSWASSNAHRTDDRHYVTAMPVRDNDAVMVLVPPQRHGKSAKSKSSKTKSGKACYILKDGIVGESYCGKDFEDASSQCATKCSSDADCSGGEMCFDGVTSCTGESYCGMDFEDASSQCTIKCSSDADCSGGETCFDGITTCPEVDGYCGSDFDDASSQCATKCTSDVDCSGGEMCFDGITACSEIDGYCGSDFEDASSQCATKCTSDADCSGGETCFGDVTACSEDDGYCGPDFETAASLCDTQCSSDGDCPTGESCFVGPLVTEYCARQGEGYCGTDVDDAASQCDPRCTSDADCSAGQSCFGGYAAELCGDETNVPTYSPTEASAPEPPAAPECPAGCPDCDPDTPLPCPSSDLKRACDKHNDELYPPGNPRAGQRVANFFDCYDMCKPSFCCIHDSLSETFSPSCAQEYANCELYYPCYIIWWKLHDTIGPATYMRVEQDEPFYEGLNFEYLNEDFAEDETFFQQLFGHHFDGDDAPNDDTFENEDNW